MVDWEISWYSRAWLSDLPAVPPEGGTYAVNCMGAGFMSTKDKKKKRGGIRIEMLEVSERAKNGRSLN